MNYVQILIKCESSFLSLNDMHLCILMTSFAKVPISKTEPFNKIWECTTVKKACKMPNKRNSKEDA